MIGLPLLLLTAYLQWWWPANIGSSAWFDLLPYLASLAAGLPFALSFASRTSHKALWIVLYVLVGIGVMEFYAVFYLCAARNMCL